MKKIREARQLLKEYGIRSVKPTELATASKQLNKSLIETLQIIAFLKSSGQGYGPFPYTTFALKGKHV